MVDYFVHESSFVDKGANIGAGTKVWHYCHIMPDAQIGRKCILGQNTFIGSGVRIGNNVRIQNNVSVYTGVILEDDVFLGPSMVFTNVINPRSHVNRHDQYQTTLIRKGATIGANATIVCGLTLGEYAFVGAGTVVTKDIPNFGLIYGNPGRLYGWMCQCGEKLHFSISKSDHIAICDSCGTKYHRESDKEIRIGE